MRVIPIAAAAALPGSCGDDDSGAVPKLDLPLARREFLKGSGVLMGTIAAGSVLAALAPSPVWAVELKTLTRAEGETLMKMGRTLYPHKNLSDAVYALLAKDLDAKASGDAAAATSCAKASQRSTRRRAAASRRQASSESCSSSRRSKASPSSRRCAASASPRCTTTTWRT